MFIKNNNKMGGSPVAYYFKVFVLNIKYNILETYKYLSKTVGNQENPKIEEKIIL